MVHPECREKWEGTETEERVLKDMTNEKGEEYEYGDRRQELVFIGMSLKYETIQKVLDECLLTDDEMKLGPEKWMEKFGEDAPLRLFLVEEEDGNFLLELFTWFSFPYLSISTI